MSCSCCSAKELVDSEVKEATAEEQKEVAEKGFVVKRRCTDVLCLGLWAAHIVLFIVVVIWGFQDGNPSKLYQPRDYQGAYCGVKTNWNNGPDLQSQTKQSYMMNVSIATDVIAKQFICSTAAKDFLLSSSGLATTSDQSEYLAACCLIPSKECQGSLSVGGDISGTLSTSNQGLDVIMNRMGDLTNAFSAANLWSTAGANAGMFNTIWNQANQYFVKTCVPTCSVNINNLNGTAARTYTYSPHPDERLYTAWKLLERNFNNTPFMQAFTYKAFPFSMCPYSAEFCVPWPGVEFSELSNGYCTFKMSTDVLNAVGSTMASSFETLGGDAFAESVTETFGAWWGDFEKSIDTFLLLCVCCFIIGLVYLVVLRFTVKFCVWFAVFLVFLSLVIGGGMAWVRHIQCKGVGFWDTTFQTGVAAGVATTTAVGNLASGVQSVSEACTNDCADYRGAQVRTRSGYLCQAWDATTPWDHSSTYSSTIYPNHGLDSTNGMQNNFCRNPYHVNDTYKASTIWCFTTSTDKRWELCTPIGVIAPQCEHGYAVSGETMRKALEICAFVIWSLALIWALLVFCFMRRIRLAVALNQVAADFVAHTPTVLIVPIVQVIVGCLWCLTWMMCASFLLSQVSSNYISPDSFATYEEAYGTATVPGKCTDKWPTGFVYKAAADECDMSNPLAPKCWKCAPPRYVLDWRFAVVFFSFLWNNAFLIALGQCMIAGAVGVWFFTANSQKGKLRKAQALRQSNWNVWRYHAGSLAFGSFILALIQFIRYLMKYFEKQAEAQKNACLAMILRVVQCCIYCFERFIQFLNKNAYIQVAIRGTPFCSSAKNAFNIIMKNILRFGTVAVLGYVIHCIGYVFIMAATLTWGYFLLKWMHDDISPVIPMIVYTFMSYLVGKLFMNVFGLAVDTCLQCVIFVEEKCPDGDFVPKCLKNILDKSKKQEEEEERGSSSADKSKKQEAEEERGSSSADKSKKQEAEEERGSSSAADSTRA